MSPNSNALALRLPTQPTQCGSDRHPVLVHHSMPASICIEWELRNNADQYKMFSWNGWVLPCAEDCETGVASKGNLRDDEWCDWSEDGLIVEARRHPKNSQLRLARAFFGLSKESGRREWRFGEMNDPGGVLDKFTPNAMRIFCVVEKHLRSYRLQPLFWGVIKALRDAQAVLKTPSYSAIEADRGAAPQGILQNQLALPPQSAERIAGRSWCGTMTLEVVADFLVGRRVFLAWSAQARAHAQKAIRKRCKKRKRECDEFSR
jgi:hypothetical protein